MLQGLNVLLCPDQLPGVDLDENIYVSAYTFFRASTSAGRPAVTQRSLYSLYCSLSSPERGQ
jgi:hypothetical protein